MNFPWPNRPGVAMDPDYLKLLREQPLIPVELAGGRPALLVTSHTDVRSLLSDDRFSREAWSHGTLFARESASLALSASDPPTHTRRRKAVQRWFTHRAAEAARPRIQQLANTLLDRIEAAGPPADLVADFSIPFAYGVICETLGVPIEDVDRMLPWVATLMSAGRASQSEAAAAQQEMYAYFDAQLQTRQRAIGHGSLADGLLTDLLRANELTEQEIKIFGAGLLMAGGETTSNFLTSCAQQLLSHPGLAETLSTDPAAIPTAIDECLRWIWFVGTGGHPHVAIEDVDLAGTHLPRGQVVVPLTDAANRDPDAFPDADDFCPARTTNPHLGFGYGRHMCLGAPHARAETEIGIAALLRRLPNLRIAIDPDHLTWRDGMFIRGVWSLPITWTPQPQALTTH
jgi:cytochrome P450